MLPVQARMKNSVNLVLHAGYAFFFVRDFEFGFFAALQIDVLIDWAHRHEHTPRNCNLMVVITWIIALRSLSHL
jgi:hypothetical protein